MHKVRNSAQKSTDKHLKQIQFANYESSKKRLEDKKRMEQTLVNYKSQNALKAKKQSIKNDKKKEKLLKRVASENRLRSEIVKQQEHFARLKREARERERFE